MTDIFETPRVPTTLEKAKNFTRIVHLIRIGKITKRKKQNYKKKKEQKRRRRRRKRRRRTRRRNRTVYTPKEAIKTRHTKIESNEMNYEENPHGMGKSGL